MYIELQLSHKYIKYDNDVNMIFFSMRCIKIMAKNIKENYIICLSITLLILKDYLKLVI